VKILQGKIEMINDTIGLDASVLGEAINPKVFGIIRDLRGTKDKKEQILKELEEEQFGGGELFWQPLKDFGLEKLREFCELLPHGIQSGLRKGFKGIFFYYKYNEDLPASRGQAGYHLWFLYDLLDNRFITNKTEILNFISCKEKEPRVIPEDLDVFEIHRKVREEIKNFFSEGLIATQIRTVHGQMEKTLIDMRDELDFIRENYLEENDHLRERVTGMIANLHNIALTKLRMRTLRRIWKNYKSSKNWHVMVAELDKFLKEKPVNEEQEVVKFDERKLKLICVDFIS
jgi:sulfur relay (sulfurtransferase) DsrC/TusE family protein